MKTNSEDFKRKWTWLKGIIQAAWNGENIRDQIDKLRDLANRQDEPEKRRRKGTIREELKSFRKRSTKKFEDPRKSEQDSEKYRGTLKGQIKSVTKKKKAEDTKKKSQQRQGQPQQNNHDGASKDQKTEVIKWTKWLIRWRKEMDSSDKEQQEEDIKALRQLLENLVSLSYEQGISDSWFLKTDIQAPRFVNLYKGRT